MGLDEDTVKLRIKSQDPEGRKKTPRLAEQRSEGLCATGSRGAPRVYGTFRVPHVSQTPSPSVRYALDP